MCACLFRCFVADTMSFHGCTQGEPLEVGTKRGKRDPGVFAPFIKQYVAEESVFQFGCLQMKHPKFPSGGVQRLRAFPFQKGTPAAKTFYNSNPQSMVCIVPDGFEVRRFFCVCVSCFALVYTCILVFLQLLRVFGAIGGPLLPICAWNGVWQIAYALQGASSGQ